MIQPPLLDEFTCIKELQTIQDDFARSAGISSVIISPEGEPITNFSNPTSFHELIQSTEKGRRCWLESLKEMTKAAPASPEWKVRYCFSKCGYYIAPIIIDGEHLATICTGQFITKRFTSEQLKSLEEIALTIGLNPVLFIEAAKKMRVLDENTVLQNARLLFGISSLIIKLEYRTNKLKKEHSLPQDAHAELENRVNQHSNESRKTNERLRQEISEHQQAEKPLIDEKNLLRSLIDLLETMDVGITVQDQNYNITYQNSFMQKNFGGLGGKCYEIYEKRHDICDGCPVKQAFRDGQPHNSERITFTPDGEAFFWETTAHPIRNSAGEITACFEVVRNVTKYKRTEEALQRLKTAIEQSMDGIAVTDLDGTVQYVNLAWASMHGYAPEELIGKHLSVFHNEIQLERDVDPFNKHVFSIGSAKGEVGHVRKNGTAFPTLMTVAVLKDENGNSIGLVGVAHDITEQKQAEANLQEAQKELQDVSRRAGMAEVATGVLHNVGNVLNSVNVSVSLIAEEVHQSKVKSLTRAANLVNEQADNLVKFITEDDRGKHLPQFLTSLAETLSNEQDTILTELQLLNKNIEHIKTIVKTQQSYAGVSGLIEPVSLDDLLEDALRINAASFQRYSIMVVREYEKLPLIEVERQKLIQILVNLVRNAKHALIEHGGKDKRITLKTTPAGEDHVKIDISDNGAGIPAHNLTKIFAYGFTTRKGSGGHGFGLHHCALLAKEMGGSLTVQSSGLGTGATFTLELPLKVSLAKQLT